MQISVINHRGIIADAKNTCGIFKLDISGNLPDQAELPH